jgi:hypothetical protein
MIQEKLRVKFETPDFMNVSNPGTGHEVTVDLLERAEL